MKYIQLYHNEPLIKIFSEVRAAYINALNEADEQQNLTIFRQFIIQQQTKFLTEEIAKYDKLDSGFSLMF